MQAVILAAGMGRRLGLERPKALIEINGITLLERLTGQLRRAGIEEILVTCGFQRDLVEAAARPLGLPCISNPDYEKSDNLVSLWSARESIRERCLVIHGDVIADDSLIEQITSALGDAVLPMDRSSIDPEAMKIRLGNGHLVDLSKSIPIRQADGESIPIMLFSPGFLIALKKVMARTVAKGRNDRLLDDAVLEVIRSGGFTVNILDVTGFLWSEIDTLQDLDKARRTFALKPLQNEPSIR